MAVVQESLRGFGYQVTNNTHFIGAEVVRQHGDPSHGIHSLQIEMNRSLFMNEAAQTRGPDFKTVQAHLSAMAAVVADYAKSTAPRSPHVP